MPMATSWDALSPNPAFTTSSITTGTHQWAVPVSLKNRQAIRSNEIRPGLMTSRRMCETSLSGWRLHDRRAQIPGVGNLKNIKNVSAVLSIFGGIIRRMSEKDERRDY